MITHHVLLTVAMNQLIGGLRRAVTAMLIKLRGVYLCCLERRPRGVQSGTVNRPHSGAVLVNE